MIQSILSFDHDILTFIANTSSPFLDAFFKYFTTLGNAGILCIAITLVLVALKKTRICGYTCAASLVYDLVICNLIMKPVFMRPRPYDFFADFSVQSLIISAPHDFSFPSGHTASCFAFSTAVFMYNKKLGIISYAFSALMGYSRLYLGVHYPTDILGGILVGIVCGIGAFCTVKSIMKAYVAKKQTK